MEFYVRSTVFFTIFILSSAQYHAQYRNPQAYQSSESEGPSGPSQAAPARVSYPEPRQSYLESSRPTTPRPLILSHKQQQTHDGGFKYAFAADNGLQQGEQINSDGSRQGAYSYVDPHGQQITIRYTAGKEGFRILEGPHKTPDVAPHQEEPETQQSYQPQQAYQPQQLSYRQPASQSPQTFTPENDGSRYTHAFHRGPTIASVAAPQPQLVRYQPLKSPEGSRNDVQQEPEYNDEPGKPYSFGNGYTFEFSG